MTKNEKEFVKNCVDYSVSELEKIDGYQDLSDNAKTILLVFTSSMVVCKSIDKIFDTMKELVK